MDEETDYIVIGGGSAGCVLANRLSENLAHRVTLIEAGGDRTNNPLIRSPLTWMQASATPDFNWGYEAEPDPFRNNRIEPMPRGKLLGGCSSINGTMYIRGHSADYDAWGAAGLTGWSYAEVLPYFRRSECHWRGSNAYHGGNGPMHVSQMGKHPTIFPAFARAAEALGYSIVEDFNVAHPEGFGIPDCTMRKGQRVSTASAFLAPARNRPNLRIETGAQVTRILMNDRQAVGVEFRRGGNIHRLRSRGEVILAAGAFNSPHLLMLSGIGQAENLKSVGIEPLIDLPGVGQNLQDHPIALTFWKASAPITFDRELRLDRLAISMVQWLARGTGPFSQSPMSIQGFVRSNSGQERPDLQFQIVHSSYAARPWFPGWRKGVGHEYSTGALLLDPESRGEVLLRSPSPDDLPAVRLNFLAEEHDRQRLRTAIRFTRRFFETQAAHALVDSEIAPGVDAESDEALDAWLRNTVMSGAHQCGTCAMGIAEQAVVDSQLKVRGTEKLRVADASVIPRIIRGNTNAPVIMIAEKASDMIRGRVPLKPEHPQDTRV